MIDNIQGISPLVVTALDSTRNTVGDESEAGKLKTAQNDSGSVDAQAQKDNRTESQQKSVEPQPATTDYSQITERLQELLSNDTTVQFRFDETTRRIVMTVVDVNTQEVIRQIPAEESLRIAKFITESFEQGQVTDAKV